MKIINMLLTLLFTCLAFFGLGEFGLSVPERLSNHCQGLRRSFSEICTTFDAHSLILCRIYREIASGQIQNSKNQYLHPAA
jgi:hypothetical protein